jgi:hypothetical protein
VMRVRGSCSCAGSPHTLMKRKCKPEHERRTRARLKVSPRRFIVAVLRAAFPLQP